MAIQMRGGLKVDFDPWKMKPKEWAVSVDPETENQIVWMCFRPGVVKRMGTYEDFREQIMEITDEIAEEFSQTINEIKVYMEGLKDATEGYKNATEGYKNTAVEKALESSNSATQASQSATNASQSATNSANSADLSEDYSKQAKSYAKGTGGEVRPNDDSDCAEFYYEQVKRVAQGIEGIIPMGTITFAELSEEYNQVKGYMFDISDDFVSDERFKNGVGIYYGAGSNVIYTADGMWDVLTPVSVMGVKGDKETVYRQGFVNLTPKDIGAATIEDLEGINADFIGTEEELNAKIASGEVTDGMTVFLRDVDGGGPGGDTVVGDLTPGKALVSDADGNVASSSVTTKELEYLSGATSNIQQQIDNINSSGVSDISDATVTFEEATVRENVNSGEPEKTLWGKAKKMFSDLKTVAFSNNYNDLNNLPDLPVFERLSPGKAIISDENGNIASSSVTFEEVESLSGVKSNLQAQIDTLAERPEPTPTEFNGAVTTILNEDLPTDKVLISDENGKVSASAVTKTQLGYLDGLTGNVQEQINYLMENVGSGGTPLSAVTALEASGKRGSAELKWTDPEDVVFNGETLAQFDGTKVVRNTEHYPTSTDDGVVAVDSKVRNQYAETPFVDGNLENDRDYYYTLFPYTAKNIYTFSDKDKAIARPIGFDSVLENNTWDMISQASRKGTASTLWKVGDKKDDCVIIGFNHDDLFDGSGKAGITFACNKQVPSSKWNGTNSTAITYSNSLANSELYRIFVGELGVNGSRVLSVDITNNIRKVKKYYLTASSFGEIEQSIFLFDPLEVGITVSIGLGNKYEGSSYISRSGIFWTRAQYNFKNVHIYAINGNNATTYNMTTSHYLRFGFCI